MKINIEKINDYSWEIPKQGAMNVHGVIYATEDMINDIKKDDSLMQVVNVSQLPGIIKASMAMPDIHSGYGFPIGGVAAFDWNQGVVSPGGVGYDINCGVRLISTGLTESDIHQKRDDLINALYNNIPSGVGSKSAIRLDLKKIITQGSKFCVSNGFGEQRDLEYTEDNGCLPDADIASVSSKAVDRGKSQLGTLGAGNHFVEVGIVEQIYNEEAARAFGLFQGQVTIMLHTGSRGFGYQVCDDFLDMMVRNASKTGLELPDKQLSYAKLDSEHGRHYLSAMACAANYAWANRQIIMHLIRETFETCLNMAPKDLKMQLVYDVCHNIAKKETHEVDGKKMTVCVHRKGATRSFPPNHPSLPQSYKHVGQPILIPGDMGTLSFVLVGTETAMKETFGSTCHGAGRLLSRSAAIKASKGRIIYKELMEKGILVKCRSRSTIAEEMPDAYKDISKVVNVVHSAGISNKVAHIKPIIVIKG